LTIEHIHPQSKANEGEWSEVVVGRLGNLILLDQKINEKLGTKAFKDKILILKNEGYSIPSALNEKDSWEVADVESHTELMAEVAYNDVWKV